MWWLRRHGKSVHESMASYLGGILPVIERAKYGKSKSLLPFCVPSAVVQENRCIVKVKIQ
jgi:hypothetical protein